MSGETTLRGDLPGVTLTSSTGWTSEVYRHGAHVASWKTPDGEDLIFVSSDVVFKPPKAIRGGIPICFPQFSDFGPLGQHGFARNRSWEIVSQTANTVTMRLSSDAESTASWPSEFAATYVASLDDAGALTTSLDIHNAGSEPMTFTTALHTYFRCADALTARVEGLRGREYLDSLDGRVRKTEDGDAVTFPCEVDRIYLSVPADLRVVDPAGRKTVRIQTENLPDAVVWNPWIEKSKATGDLGDEDYKAFVCVEAAAIETPVVVPPGGSWKCRQVLTMEKSDRQ